MDHTFFMPEQCFIFEGNKQNIHLLPLNDNRFKSEPFFVELLNFLHEWFDDSATITLYSSGSTGKAKKIEVSKQKMINSALMTCRFLQLKAGDKALLCLPLSYIAGKMMVVRALVTGLDLYIETPSGHPLAHQITPFQFVALVPMQVYNSLQQPEELQRLKQIKNLLIGGSHIDSQLQQALNHFTNPIYATYGMAETVSHVAMSRINSSEGTLWYHPLEDVSLTHSKEKTLIIHAPKLCEQPIETRDVVQFRSNGDFSILGRIDNVINSSGIKVQIEEIESLLRPYFTHSFAITSEPSPKFGELIVLVTEACQVDLSIFNVLPEFQRPKKIYHVETLPLTASHKINRAEVRTVIFQPQSRLIYTKNSSLMGSKEH